MVAVMLHSSLLIDTVHSRTASIAVQVNTYNFYVSVVSGAPVQYHMMGYDTLFVRAHACVVVCLRASLSASRLV